MGYTRTVVVCRVYRLRNFVPTGYPVLLLLLLFVDVAIVVKQIENKNEERILNIYILLFYLFEYYRCRGRLNE